MLNIMQRRTDDLPYADYLIASCSNYNEVMEELLLMAELKCKGNYYLYDTDKQIIVEKYF